MVQTVVWTTEALFTYEKVIEYLSENFSETDVIKFSTAVINKITLIQLNPYAYRKSEKFANVHFTIILKRILLIYRFRPRKNEIEILQFWDARQNPRKFKY